MLITGATGYVGPVVIQRLRTSYPNEQLRAIDAGWFLSQHDGTEPAYEVLLDELILGDIRDASKHWFIPGEPIVHLAGVSNDPIGHQYASVTKEINEVSTLRMAQLAKESGASAFVFASSASVYGAGSPEPRKEDSAINPQTAYANSKIRAEIGLSELASSDFKVTCLRFATACGWSPRLRLDLVLNDFVASAIATGRIAVLSDGLPWRPLIHVRDMARAVDWSVSRSRQEHSDYVVVNVGSDEWNFQVRDLAHAVASVLGDIAVDINTEAQSDRRSYRLDFSLWRQMAPDHQPAESLPDTIKELAFHMKNLPDLDSEFRASNRIRLKRLEELQATGWIDETLRWRSGSHGTTSPSPKDKHPVEQVAMLHRTSRGGGLDCEGS